MPFLYAMGVILALVAVSTVAACFASIAFDSITGYSGYGSDIPDYPIEAGDLPNKAETS